MSKFLRVILHLLGYPLLIAAVFYFDWNIIKTQTGNYGIFVFVGVLVSVLMCGIYYICYACITSKKRNERLQRKRKTKSVFNQTLRLCLVVVITMTGLWCVCDLALPDFLADATSSTIFYEDLADGWVDREEVNEDLLNAFIEMSVKAETLPKGDRTEEEAIKYYQGVGLKNTVAELSDNEYYKSVGGLLAIQYQSINAKGYTTFTHPWIDFATSDRLTIPCLVHLLLDKKMDVDAANITEDKFCKKETDKDGNTVITEVFFAEYDKTQKEIVLKDVNWTVLDMLGTDTVIDLSGLMGTMVDGIGSFTVGALQGLTRGDELLVQIVDSVAKIAGDKDIVNGDIEVIVDMSVDQNRFDIILRPSNAKRGVLGYQEMAWLDSNGLIYALVTLFSCRKLFLMFAAWGVFINLLIGCTRGMCKEEREKRRKINAPIITEEEEPSTDVIDGNFIYGKIVKW